MSSADVVASVGLGLVLGAAICAAVVFDVRASLYYGAAVQMKFDVALEPYGTAYIGPGRHADYSASLPGSAVYGSLHGLGVEGNSVSLGSKIFYRHVAGKGRSRDQQRQK